MKKIVLLIEDNIDINETTSELLELADYKVISTNNGKEGIKLALQFSPDIIICDIRMPEKNGYEVLNQLKSNAKTSKIPFIFFTASTESIDMKIGISLGASAYLCKPFTEEDLLKTIKKSMELPLSIIRPSITH